MIEYIVVFGSGFAAGAAAFAAARRIYYSRIRCGTCGDIDLMFRALPDGVYMHSTVDGALEPVKDIGGMDRYVVFLSAGRGSMAMEVFRLFMGAARKISAPAVLVRAGSGRGRGPGSTDIIDRIGRAVAYESGVYVFVGGRLARYDEDSLPRHIKMVRDAGRRIELFYRWVVGGGSAKV